MLWSCPLSVFIQSNVCTNSHILIVMSAEHDAEIRIGRKKKHDVFLHYFLILTDGTVGISNKKSQVKKNGSCFCAPT